MPKLCDGDYGEMNTSGKGIGKKATCVFCLESHAFNTTYRQKCAAATALPAPACLITRDINRFLHSRM